jgi:hypothetical protein
MKIVWRYLRFEKNSKPARAWHYQAAGRLLTVCRAAKPTAEKWLAGHGV